MAKTNKAPKTDRSKKAPHPDAKPPESGAHEKPAESAPHASDVNLEDFDQHLARIRSILNGLQDRLHGGAESMADVMMRYCDTRTLSSVSLARALQREALAGMMAYGELATLAGELLGRADSLLTVEQELGVLSPAGEVAATGGEADHGD